MKLPVSGREIEFRAPCGSDDLALLESGGSALEQALVAVARLSLTSNTGRDTAAEQIDWLALTVTDFECALLGLRHFLLGDSVACLLKSKDHACGEVMEMNFSIAALLQQISPRMPKGVSKAAGGAHSFDLDSDGGGTRFRLPEVKDQLAAMRTPNGGALLMSRCTGDAKLTRPVRARVERAMEALAPVVSRQIEGICPACGKAVKAMLQVPRLVAEEFTRMAAGVYAEVDLLASEYHWDEAAILAMPQSRRRAYAGTVRERRGK